MAAHILPCALEAEIIAAIVYVLAHARDVQALLVTWITRRVLS